MNYNRGMTAVPTGEKRKRLSDFTREEREAMTLEEMEPYCTPEVFEFMRNVQEMNERLGITEEYSRAHYARLVAIGLA